MFPPRLTDSTEDDFVRNILRAGRRDVAVPAHALIAKYMDTRDAGVKSASLRAEKSWARRPATLFGSITVAAICMGWALRTSRDPAPPTPSPLEIVRPAATDVPPLRTIEHRPETSRAAAVRVEDLPPAPKPLELRSSPIALPFAAGRGPRKAMPDTEIATTSLGDELALVEAARASLTRSDADDCLRTLDGYDRRFRSGVLGDEVATMRIEALALRGDRDRAHTLARDFLAKAPSSPYTSRIQSVLAAIPE